jgi:hypothetical protein
MKMENMINRDYKPKYDDNERVIDEFAPQGFDSDEDGENYANKLAMHFPDETTIVVNADYDEPEHTVIHP